MPGSKKKEGIDILSSRNHNSAREDRNTLEAFENILLSLMLKRHKKNCNGVKKKKRMKNYDDGCCCSSAYELARSLPSPTHLGSKFAGQQMHAGKTNLMYPSR